MISFKKISLVIIMTFFLASSTDIHSKTKTAIIFDLSTLVTTSKSRAFDLLGKALVTKYTVGHGQTPHAITPKLYKLLDMAEGHTNSIAIDPYGNLLPSIFCECLKGEKNGSEVINNIQALIMNDQSHFTGSTERKLAAALAHIMFDAQKFIQTQKLDKEMLKLLKACVKAGHEIFLFSNYSDASFKAIQQKFPDIFTLVPSDNIIISGQVGCMKPEPDMYQILLFRLRAKGIEPNPQNCFLIDLQQKYLAPALELGITGITYQNAKSTKKVLRAHKIVSKK